MTETEKQFRRVERLLEKVRDNRNRDSDDYEDDVRNFFIHCWSLKDYLKNDSALSPSVRNSVEKDVKRINHLMIAADLANKAKHLKLIFPPRVDAEVSKRNLHIQGGTVNMHVIWTSLRDTPRVFHCSRSLSIS